MTICHLKVLNTARCRLLSPFGNFNSWSHVGFSLLNRLLAFIPSSKSQSSSGVSSFLNPRYSNGLAHVYVSWARHERRRNRWFRAGAVADSVTDAIFQRENDDVFFIRYEGVCNAFFCFKVIGKEGTNGRGMWRSCSLIVVVTIVQFNIQKKTTEDDYYFFTIIIPNIQHHTLL